ncbi:Selenide, water dikinase [bacterium HR36]|nr:Selenide, water dikinase [bacterium HR36]
MEGKPDPVRLEVFYDAQTSGGLLIAVAPERLDELTDRLQKDGCLAAVVGEVLPPQDNCRLIACAHTS